MKTFIITILLLVSNTLSSQYITGLSVTQNGDNQIKTNLKVYLPSLGEFLSSSTSVDQNVITLSVCYFMTDFGAISNLENDFYIDISNNSNYTLKINLYTSVDSETCNYQNLEDTVTLNFSTPIDGTFSMSTVNTDNKTKAISLFPNPVKDVLYFSEEVSNVKITDMSGKMVKEFSAKGKSVNVANLAKGVYMISAVAKSGEVLSRKIIKE